MSYIKPAKHYWVEFEGDPKDDAELRMRFTSGVEFRTTYPNHEVMHFIDAASVKAFVDYLNIEVLPASALHPVRKAFDEAVKKFLPEVEDTQLTLPTE